MNVEDIAKITHQANKAYCETVGDNSQKDWGNAEQWQRESAIQGVQFRLNNPQVGPHAQHVAWMLAKVNDGWTHGPVKDAALKQHPCLVPYDELPEAQKVKDKLFQAVVDALK